MTTDITNFASLPAMAAAQARQKAHLPALWEKRDGVWRSLSWDQMMDQIMGLAGGLIGLGLVPGDRVILLSENRPHWAIADLGIMTAGGVTVPVYTTNTAADHRHILENSGARFAIVSTPHLAERLLTAVASSSHPIQIISIAPLAMAQTSGPMPLAWDDVVAKGQAYLDQAQDSLDALTPHHTACLIYTSGTGGAPKGVKLSHRNILSNVHGASLLLAELGLGDDVFLSFLPLSHAYEHTAGLMLPLGLGAQIYYAESIDALAANMAEIHPTIMAAVPRLYETMRAKILNGVQRQGGIKAKLFHATVKLGLKRIAQGRLNPIDAFINTVLTHLVRSKIKARFGGRLKALVSGGAPLAPELGYFFSALGLCVLQGYGQTEAGPVISCSPPSRPRLDTVGPPMVGIEARVAEDGEIQVRGDNVMQGYWNDTDSTKRVIVEGWLCTGDVGEIDPDGYIRITDRKKDIIVVSGGDTLSPQRLEGLLTLQPEISQAMVIGDARPHLTALIVPNADWASAASDTSKGLAAAVERVNATLSPIERVRKFAVLAQPFTIENAMLTPSLKIRRHVIRQTYQAEIDGLYNKG